MTDTLPSTIYPAPWLVEMRQMVPVKISPLDNIEYWEAVTLVVGRMIDTFHLPVLRCDQTPLKRRAPGTPPNNGRYGDLEEGGQVATSSTKV